MFDPKIIQEMAKQFVDSLPAGLKNFNKELEGHFNQFAQQCFNKMELITREEFDIQMQVLAKTRQKVEALEQTVALLEKELKIKD